MMATAATTPTARRSRHVPVMREECLALLAPALDDPGRVVVDATLGLGGHAEALLANTPARLIGIDRDPDALRAAAARLAPFGDRVHPRARRLRRAARGAGRPRPDPDRRRADRPRRLLDAAGRGRARLRLRRRRAAGHADGPDPGADRRGRPEHLPGRRAGPDPARLRRGAVRPQDRRVRSSGSAPGSRSPPARGWSSWSGTSIPAAGPADRRQPGQAHLPGAADRGQRRARGAGPGDAGGDRARSRSAAGWPSWPTTRWRTGS